MRTATKKTSLIPLVLILSLSLMGCSMSQIVTDIEIVSTGIYVAAPIVAVFAGPGAQIISAYLVAASGGLNCVLAAAQAPGSTTASVSAAVATCLAAAVAPVLPAGTPPNITALINVIAQGIANLVNKYGPKATSNLKVSPLIHLGYSDHRKIVQIRKQLDKALVTLVENKK